MRKLLYILLLLPFALAGQTNYYFSNDGDDDTGDGTLLKPYKTIAKANTISLVAGDSLLFKRGDIWREQFALVGKAGTSENRIVVGLYGTGDAPILYGSKNGDVEGYWTSLGGNKYASANSSFTYAVNMLFYNTNATQATGTKVTLETDLNVNWEFWYDSTNDRVIVYHSGGSPDTQANGIEITGVFNYNDRGYVVTITGGSDYVTVRDLDVRYSNYSGYVAYQSDHVHFVNCDLRYTHNKGFYTIQADDMVIDSCYLNGVGYTGITTGGEAIWVADGVRQIIRNNELLNCYNNYINIFNSDTVTVEKNYCHTQPETAYAASSGVYFDNCSVGVAKKNTVNGITRGFAVNAEQPGYRTDSIMFYNNIAINNEIQYKTNCGQADYTGDVTNIYFYHNISYYDEAGNANYAAFRIEKATGVTIKNNIIYDQLSANKYEFRIYSTAIDVESDYNNFYLGTSTHNFHYGTVVNEWLFYATLADYQTASSQDANSIGTDPLFVSASTNFDLQSESPAIGAGIAIAAVTTDYVDSTYADPPAIGAYEYFDDNPATAPIVVTSIQPYRTGASTAIGKGNVTSDGGGTISARGLCWSTSENPTIADSKTEESGTTGEFTSTLTGVSVGQTWHVRAYATNETTTGYGEDKIFRIMRVIF